MGKLVFTEIIGQLLFYFLVVVDLITPTPTREVLFSAAANLSKHGRQPQHKLATQKLVGS